MLTLSQKTFIAIGECMVELAPAANGLLRRGFAGDTFNAAWYARSCLPDDWAVSYATCIGDDAVSDEMLAFMEEAGIKTEAIRREADATVGLYLISLSQGERSFSYWRGQSAARRIGSDPEWLAHMLAGKGMIHFSGITLAILPSEGREVLLRALAEARKSGASVSFDTNIRPALWESPNAMRQAFDAAAAVSDVVLPSFDEERGCFGDQHPEDTINRYRDKGVGMVVVKNGAEAVTLWTSADGLNKIPPAPVDRVVDTTAAGDSFAGAFLAALGTGATPSDAVARGSGVAARVIGATGALVPLG